MYLVVLHFGKPYNHFGIAIAPRRLYLEILFAKTGSKSEKQASMKQSSENEYTLICRAHCGAIMVETITDLCNTLVVSLLRDSQV
jgi:hypothetical protein